MATKTFKEWLIQSKGLSEKSAGDVQSRLNRAKKLVSFKATDKLKKIIDALNEDDDFNALTMTIRSQVRRAVKLHKEYLDN
jgi:hypothetical protein